MHCRFFFVFFWGSVCELMTCFQAERSVSGPLNGLVFVVLALPLLYLLFPFSFPASPSLFSMSCCLVITISCPLFGFIIFSFFFSFLLRASSLGSASLVFVLGAWFFFYFCFSVSLSFSCPPPPQL